jgi:hypothetical protein
MPEAVSTVKFSAEGALMRFSTCSVKLTVPLTVPKLEFSLSLKRHSQRHGATTDLSQPMNACNALGKGKLVLTRCPC